MAKVINIKTRKPMPVTRDQFFDLTDAVKEVVKELPNVDIKVITDLLTEMKFCACFNENFRQKTFSELEELFYILHERVSIKS
jgi:hypothetical protein